MDRGTGGFAFHLNPFTGASPINVADLNRIVPSLYSRFCGASYYRGDCPLVSSGFLGSTIGDIYTFEQDGILSVYLSNGEAGILIDELEVTP